MALVSQGHFKDLQDLIQRYWSPLRWRIEAYNNMKFNLRNCEPMCWKAFLHFSRGLWVYGLASLEGKEACEVVDAIQHFEQLLAAIGPCQGFSTELRYNDAVRT